MSCIHRDLPLGLTINGIRITNQFLVELLRVISKIEIVHIILLKVHVHGVSVYLSTKSFQILLSDRFCLIVLRSRMASLFKSTTTYDPIFALLNADTTEEQDNLTEKWRDHKLAELNFIGIVVSRYLIVLLNNFSYDKSAFLVPHSVAVVTLVSRSISDYCSTRVLCSRVFLHLLAPGPPFYLTAPHSHGQFVHAGTAESFYRWGQS